MGKPTETTGAAVISDPAEILVETIRALLLHLEARPDYAPRSRSSEQETRCLCTHCQRARRLLHALKINLLVFECHRAGVPLRRGVECAAAAAARAGVA